VNPTKFLIFRSAEKKALQVKSQFYATPDMKRKDPHFTRVINTANLGHILAWKSGLKRAFTAFRALLPSVNISAE
jgi:hypothetical protein